ncbi:amino acid adenylation domain-containing protein [Rhodococcus pyridinivorans]|uniref:amino acid adenylation domain-containing protein n=1 Tax=Rhodococcus pyridinivorans TaxID=103816 RepID=UPI0020791158|nr:non-ribosomal peptide synthetase [Rhodococcus pyridinivorans]USI89216.1 amino acid adenylation domain-containing protein [Rhodococcus pyridinivorans]
MTTSAIGPESSPAVSADAHRQRGSRRWNHRLRRRPATALLPHLLAAAVERDPSGIAMLSESGSTTYAELDAASSRLARLLIGRGIGPEDVVALAFVRSPESVVATWAVAKTGAAFVPVDPTYPPDRVEHMVVDCGAVTGLTLSDTASSLPETVEWLRIDAPDVSSEAEALASTPVGFDERRGPLRPDNAAYVIYTSGSTGRPKGVVVTHTGLANFCAEQVERYGLTADSRTLHFASPSFDASVLELLLAVGASSTMVVTPRSVFGGGEFAEFVLQHGVTHAFVTPAALSSVDPSGLGVLNTVIVGGEACPPELVTRWAPGRRFFNGYGPTETTIMSNISDELAPGDRVTIGPPIRNVSESVLDSRLHPVPAGVVGELYVSGPGVARGYHGRPGLTATRFVAAAGGTRMYRTGDVVRGPESADAGIVYVGRNDFQVKVRGFRIELGEIDAALSSFPGVDFAVTLGRPTPAGETRLVAYVHGAGAALDADVLTRHVADLLPAYMVPAAVVVLDRIPLTPSGKVDRAALPEPGITATEFRSPATVSERAIAEVFADVLGVDRVGLDDNFFDLGGNSLLATSVTGRLRTRLGVTVGAAALFEEPTVAGLACRLDATSSGGTVPLVARLRPARLPLSYAQQRMWFLNRLDPESAVYNIPLAVRLAGTLDIDAMRTAFADIVERHETLRTVYPEVDGTGEQRILEPGRVTVDVPVEQVPAEALVERLATVAGRGFDVTAEVPVRAHLFETGTDDHVLMLVMHHIAGDGTSLAPLVRDLVTAYTARAEGRPPAWTPLPVQYADYTLWQREVLGSDDDPGSVAGRQLAYWTEALAGIPDHLDLATDHVRPAILGSGGGTVRTELDGDTYESIIALARRTGTTPFMVVHAALAALLARLSNTHDVVIGTPVAGRSAPELDDLVGMFVNMLALRTDVDLGASFTELLDQARRVDIAAFDHADVPFERLVEVLDPVRSPARHPLFQVGLSYHNFTLDALELPGLRVEPLDASSSSVRFDLHVTIVDRGVNGGPGGFDIEFGYATDLFDESSVRRMVDRYLRILSVVADDADVVVGDIDLHDPDQLAAMLEAWEAEQVAVGPGRTLADLFADQVRATPSACALVDAKGELTYGEFATRVRRLARMLIEHGVGPETVVALPIRRSIDLVVAMYAVVEAGGAYLPLDPDHPRERIEYIVESADPACVLTTGRDRIDLPGDRPTIEVDTVDLAAYDGRALRNSDRLAPLRAGNAAYVIYTSGSTGRPKGVVVSHEAIVNQLVWKKNEYRLGEGDAVLLKTAATFDLSVWEFWSAPTSGAKLVIASPDGHRDPAYLNDLIRRENVTTLHVVPSMLDALLDDAEGELPGSLRRVLAIGEVLPVDTAERTLEHSDTDLVNLYGPTEAAVSVTAHRVTETAETSVPIGAPIPNTQVFVLDDRLHPVPPGVAGELYLAGAQLARGYLGRPELTSERFVANPFGAPGTRLYRTGDVVRWRFDDDGLSGTLEYLDRADFQVKVRGFRIELGEIESALRALPQVRDAVVTVQNGDRIVAFVVPVAESPDIASIRAALTRTLPSYMVPQGFVTLDVLPLNANGKLDRKALPEAEVASAPYRAPRSRTETVVASIYAEVLGTRDRVGLDDDFFGIGGNSLSAVKVAARLRDVLDAHVELPWLFLHSGVEELAARIDAHGDSARDALGDSARDALGDAGLDLVLPLRAGGEGAPVFCIHPVTGLAWGFAGLVPYLGDRPVYGLQSPALGASGALPSSIDAWADEYARRIREIHPHGPYHLVGWSMGGILAQAVAIRLRRAGQEVPTLALLDAYPETRGAAAPERATAPTVAEVLGFGRDVPEASVPFTELTPENAQKIVEGLPAPFDVLTPERIERIVEGVRHSYTLLASHRPEVYDGDLTVFVAEVDRSASSAETWYPFVNGLVTTREVPVSHWDLATRKAWAVIGPALGRRLDSGR